MSESSKFCTCTHLRCPLHPDRHDKGCTPCIQKNLRSKEIPECFFHLVDHGGNRSGDSFLDFAQLVMDKEI